MDPVLGLEPEGDEDVYVGGFGVATGPFEHRLEVFGVPDLIRRFVMEAGIVDDTLAAVLILLCDIMGEVVFAEFVIMGKEPFDAAVFFFPGLITVSKSGH